jgi:hypothetical protein
MSPTIKSFICALLLAAAAGFAVAHWWHQTAGSIAAGLLVVPGLFMFGKLFGVPNR